MPKKIIFFYAFYRALGIIWKSNKKLAFINVFLQLLLAVIPLINLYILKGLIDLVLKHDVNAYSQIVKQILVLLFIQIINAVLNQLAQYYQIIQQQGITDYVSILVTKKAIDVPFNHYENSDYHDSLHLAQYQALYKVPVLTIAVNQMIQQGLNVILLSILFVTIQWYYFFLFVLIGLPLAFVKWHYSNKTNQLERKNVGLERQSNFLNWVLTSLEYAKEVRIFDFGIGYLSKFKNIRIRISNEKKRIGYQNAWAGFWAQLIEIVSICYIYFKIAIQTLTGVLSIGSFVLYFQAFQRLQTSLKSFLDSLVQLFQLRTFLNDLFIFLDLPEYEKQKSEVLLNPGKGINITQLSFSYPRSDKKALKNVSLHCKPGSLIALVGENGSGKSTLVKLLTGLYHVEDEAINIYGVPVNKIPENQLRKKISVIFQDFNMYDATVTENIGLDLGVNNERIIDSAKATGADRFIKNFPLGYDTLLGTLFKKSEQLSGGQWQKLAISRALYRNSEIIILDEPTSHIDPIAESDIIENLKNKIGDKIVILITHRLYNLKKADFIYALHQGEIIEQGTFKELIVKEGLFKRMYEKQKL